VFALTAVAGINPVNLAQGIAAALNCAPPSCFVDVNPVNGRRLQASALAQQVYAVRVTLMMMTAAVVANVTTSIAALPSSPIRITSANGGTVALSSIVLSVTPPVMTITTISPSLPPSAPPTAAAMSPIIPVAVALSALCVGACFGAHLFLRRRRRQASEEKATAVAAARMQAEEDKAAMVAAVRKEMAEARAAEKAKLKTAVEAKVAEALLVRLGREELKTAEEAKVAEELLVRLGREELKTAEEDMLAAVRLVEDTAAAALVGAVAQARRESEEALVGAVAQARRESEEALAAAVENARREKERAATLEEQAERQRELEERESQAREARKAARATLLAKVVVEWSDLKLGKQVANGGGGGNCGIGTIWEASVDDAAVVGEVRAVDDIRASPRSRAQPSPRSMFKLVSPRQLPPPLPAAGAHASRTIAASIAPSLPDGLAARILPDEVVSRHAHEALVEVALALYSLSPHERMHPHVLPIVGMATNGVRQYALLTPRCPTSLQRLLHLAESAPAQSALSLRLSLITEWNNMACAIVDGLMFLHGQGVAHAALHPGNVLLDAQMQPQLTDYGPSMCRLRATHARATATATAAAAAAANPSARTSPQRGKAGNAAGSGSPGASSVSEPLAADNETMLYLSPELLSNLGTAQLWSAKRALDIPSDLWALGCLLTRLTSIKPLYYKEWPAMVKLIPESVDERATAIRTCISSGAWRPVAQLQDEAFLPSGLREVVDNCTSLEPAERPSSSEVHLALTRLLEEERARGGGSDTSPKRPLADAYRAVAHADGLFAAAAGTPSHLERRQYQLRDELDQLDFQLDKLGHQLGYSGSTNRAVSGSLTPRRQEQLRLGPMPQRQEQSAWSAKSSPRAERRERLLHLEQLEKRLAGESAHAEHLALDNSSSPSPAPSALPVTPGIGEPRSVRAASFERQRRSEPRSERAASFERQRRTPHLSIATSDNELDKLDYQFDQRDSAIAPTLRRRSEALASGRGAYVEALASGSARGSAPLAAPYRAVARTDGIVAAFQLSKRGCEQNEEVAFSSPSLERRRSENADAAPLASPHAPPLASPRQARFFVPTPPLQQKMRLEALASGSVPSPTLTPANGSVSTPVKKRSPALSSTTRTPARFITKI
jgi:serine/threonine protein kinase